MLAKSNEESKTITIKQAAEKANVTQATIHNWIKSGKLSGSKQGKAWQISPASLALCLGNGKTNQIALSDEAFSHLASKVVAELKPVLEQALALQQSSQAKTTELDSRVTKLEKELAKLKQSQVSQGCEKPASQTVQPDNATRQETKQQGNSKANQVSQSKTEPVSLRQRRRVRIWVRIFSGGL